MSRQAINGPPVLPPLYSLLQAATVLEDGETWQQGVEWSPEQIGGGATVALDCAGNSSDGKTDWHNPIVNTADPFVVYAEDHCSTFGFESRDYAARARRQLLATQSARIAAEFQFGLIAGVAAGGDNTSLDDATTVNDGATLAESIAALEGAMAEKYDGSRGMIHVTPATLDLMLAERLIYQAGQKWLTATGTIVVADAGYTADSSTVYAYGTPMVAVRLSPVLVPMNMREATDRSLNFVRFYAERLALVQVDHSDEGEADLFFRVDTGLTAWSLGS